VLGELLILALVIQAGERMLRLILVLGERAPLLIPGTMSEKLVVGGKRARCIEHEDQKCR
jgi:hypothetical protein